MNYKVIILYCMFVLLSKYSSAQWQSFDNNSSVQVYKLYYDSSVDTLFAIGKFIDSSGIQYEGLCKWDNSNWIEVGNIHFNNYPPKSICRFQGSIYIGGNFSLQSGFPGNYILKFNGVGWDSLPSSPNGEVHDLAVFQNQLWVIGFFTFIGNNYTDHLSQFDGLQWTYFSTLLQLYSRGTLYADSSKIYFGGQWAGFQTDSFSNLFCWNGNAFESVGSGLPNANVIYTINSFNNKLIIGGDFSHFQNPGENIVSWNNSSFNDLIGGTNGRVYCTSNDSDHLFIGGEFTSVGNINASKIAQWNGARWCADSSSINGTVYNMVFYHDDLVICGLFTNINSQPFNHLAKFHAPNFSSTCSFSNGIEQANYSSFNFNIYTNTFTNELIVELDNNKFKSIKIMDLFGIIQDEYYSQSDKISISTQNYVAGIYFCYVSCDNNKFMRKFIIN